MATLFSLWEKAENNFTQFLPEIVQNSGLIFLPSQVVQKIFLYF